MTNTKARHKEIYDAAVEALKEAGGVETINSLPKAQQKSQFRTMVSHVAEVTGCTIDTARRNVAKVCRNARHDEPKEDNWGGRRPNQVGPPPLAKDQRRIPVSTRLAPGSKELAQAIAEALELDGWGRAVDLALERMVKNDPFLLETKNE
jgi:hypothetical protein